MTRPQQVLFALHSNAFGLVSGSSVETVRRRLKFATLLHDEVLVEAGGASINAGAGGSIALKGLDRGRWQTPRERGSSQRLGFTMSAAVEEIPGVIAKGPYRNVISSPGGVSWEPTFSPFWNEIPTSLDSSIELTHLTDPPRLAKAAVAELSNGDRGDSILEAISSTDFIRNRVVTDFDHDFAYAVGFGVPISVDRAHATVLRARIARQQAKAEGISVALPILAPRSGALSWSQIEELRRHPYWAALRKVLAEIGDCAVNGDWNHPSLDEKIHELFAARMSRSTIAEPQWRDAIVQQTLVMLCAQIGRIVVRYVFGPLPVESEGVEVALGAGAFAYRRMAWRRNHAWTSAWAGLLAETNSK